MSNKSDIVNITVEKDFYWSAYQQAIGFNNLTANNTWAFKGGSIYTVFDTGSSGLMLSSDYFIDIVELLFGYIGTQNFQI
jgi:hypothetical protein